MPERLTRLLPGLLTMILLTGCTNAIAGSPTAGDHPTGSAPPTSREPNRYGAPTVASPLDATKFFTDPCAVIPPAQRPGLGLIDPGEPETSTSILSHCGWAKGDKGGAVAFLRGNRNGLADLYRRNSTSPEAYWEETTVEGYPAVFHDTPDLRSRGHCIIAVGLNDTLAMNVQGTGRSGSPVCERAKQIAAVAVTTIKNGQG